MIVALVAGALFSHEILWTPISAVNMTDIVTNQFKMTNASFAGTDKNGDPFKIYATSGRQEYDTPDIILLDGVSGITTRRNGPQKITDKIKARTGIYNRTKKTITLRGNVTIDSSNGDKLSTNELVIRL